MSEERVLRNHWSVVASGTARIAVVMAFVLVFILQTNGILYPETFAALYGTAVGTSLIVRIIIWKKTLYYFLEDEIIVRKTTIFRSETRIRYERLASVNVERDFVCRLLGATKLSFNLNSSVNAASAEAFIVLKNGEAEKLREEMEPLIFGRPAAAAEEETESLVEVTLPDIILHSFIGMPTPQFGFGLVMLAYSVLSLALGGGISIIAALLFILDFFLPAISSFFRLYGYRITRSGDTVSVSSGFFSTRNDSFLLSKVNFVKIREPLICRLAGKAILEVEVVGTANGKGVPLLCPLKSKAVAMDLFRTLLPEFECSGETLKQPGSALAGIAVRISAVIAVSYAALAVAAAYYGDYIIWICVAAAGIAALCAIWAILTYKVREFACDSDIALIVAGSCDRVSNYILLDKIQFADVRAGPLERRFGTARCRLSLLSTAGASTVLSGVFPAEKLEAVSSEVLKRIEDGRYDFRRFQ